MNNFLDGFTQKNYNKNQAQMLASTIIESDSVQKNHISEESSHIFVLPERSDQLSCIPENAKFEAFERPHDIKKRAKRQILSTIVIIAFFLSIIIMLFYVANLTKTPNFVGYPFDRVHLWGIQNNIYVDAYEEYSLAFLKGMVIEQAPAPETTLFKGLNSTIQVIISKGADPQEHIRLPVFNDMTIREIEKWIEESRADNVTINRAYDNKIPVDSFVKSEFRSPGVTAENYRREDRLVITISRGPENRSKTNSNLIKGEVAGHVQNDHPEPGTMDYILWLMQGGNSGQKKSDLSEEEEDITDWWDSY